jgi:hypothetical protein
MRLIQCDTCDAGAGFTVIADEQVNVIADYRKPCGPECRQG